MGLDKNLLNQNHHNSGAKLPDTLKSGIENLSGMSMDDVKVHYNSGKPATLNAFAYSQGNHIHIAPGQEHHLAHEAWHVVQQRQGRVQPTMTSERSTSLSAEADAIGRIASLPAAAADH